MRKLALSVLAVLALAAPARALSTATVSGAAQGVSSITWTWGTVSGATSYNIVSTSTFALLGSTTGTSFTLTSLSTNTQYGVAVAATSGVQTTTSAASLVYTQAAQPSGTTLLGQRGLTEEDLGWATNGNPASTVYKLDWWVGASTAVVVSTQATSGASSATVSIVDLPGNQNIFFEAQAVNGDGIGTPFDIEVSTSFPPIAGQTTMSSATALGVSSITWYWALSPSATGYQLFSSTGGAVSPQLSSTTLQYTQIGLSTNTAYTDFIQAIGPVVSTNSAPLTWYTLAAPTTGLSAVVASTSSASVALSWGPNGNPAGTTYDVLWWSTVSSTITVSTQATSALLSGIFAGNTVYFTIQAQNGNGLLSGFDATYPASAPAVYIGTGSTSIPTYYAGTLNFLLQTAQVGVRVASGTFNVPVNLTAVTPSSCAPPSCVSPPGGGLSELSPKILLQLTAYDGSGNPVEPVKPLAINVAYTAGSLGSAGPNNVTLARYDSNHGWVTLATQKLGNTLSALTDHLSVFEVMQVSAATDLSSITVGPIPLRPIVNPGQVMTFRNLPVDARVRIFNYVGEKLFDAAVDASGTLAWDGRNRSGAFVASGIYLALIEGSGTKKILRVAVER